ncbi:ABC transporter ATP-binding protein [Williamsia sp.]|uniref:ATP-binding cassette domain-containing protein n=1 Tax=Williamsia sp. TaxID=1872085 RepID=UPI001A1BE445|nr:ABC transporter ATP-binding protein [Williamsia sp.]MBJ7287289.1 ABC transporter ATP-binding protein [Williamsia sp.]
MTTTTSRPSTTAPTPRVGAVVVPAQTVDWRRLRRPAAGVALVALAIAAILQSIGTVIIGRVAANPAGATIALLAGCLVGYALLDTAGRTVWAAIADRAEGRLRDDLLTAALHQPLERLSEQAVGEVLDRVDDDTHEVGTLVRLQVWDAMRTVFSTLPMWIVAGVTWWPAWIIFPVLGPVAILVIRPLLRELRDRKVAEEIAWTDHAAAMEEGIAARDDMRTSLGQAYLLRRCAEISGTIQDRFRAVIAVESRIAIRCGGLLHALLGGVVVAGVALVADNDLDVASLVTLFLVSSGLIGQINQLARHLPELQAGMGAIIRLRQLVGTDPEPVGGQSIPDGPVDIVLRDLRFAYAEGVFALDGIDLTVSAGSTCALVGRTGSGKSTLASLVSRAVDPEPGSLFVGGVDVLDLDLHQLRASVGVVTQRTEILAGTLAENIALFAQLPHRRLQDAVDELDLTAWVDGLPDGLDTILGPGGTTLSAGEEQLVAFARLLVRDVRVVILDEATARMDPLTEARVVRAADRLLADRTGILIAHRLSTVTRADHVAVLERGHIIDQGPRVELESRPGPFRRLLDAAGSDAVERPALHKESADQVGAIGGVRRQGPPPEVVDVGDGPSLTRGIAHIIRVHPTWGLLGCALFAVNAILGATGALTGYVWGHVVQNLQRGETPVTLTVSLVIVLLANPITLAAAIRRFLPWWSAASLRIRMTVLEAQTRQHGLPRTPPGEVMSRVLDSDRFLRYSDRWIDVTNGLFVVVTAAVLGGSVLAGGILLAVMIAAAAASLVGRPIAGRSAAAASATRAHFGRSLVSSVESVRTVKLAAATDDVHAHLRGVDGGRVDAAVREHRVQSVLIGVPVVMVQLGVVAAWVVYLLDGWDLATALLVSGAVGGFDYFGRVAGAVITEAPGTRAWQKATSRFAGGADLMDIPPGVDLWAGTAPRPVPTPRTPLRRLELRDMAAVHDDGTRGVSGVDLTVEAGELVLLLGQVGSGKSSLLASLCGLVGHTGAIRWNDLDITDAQTFLRPGQVAHVAQVPRVLSGTFADNVRLDHDRPIERAVTDARLESDVAAAGGIDSIVGHRGVRLSGGQVQRLALARALAIEPELLLADDVSSALDATTEVELWAGLRARGITVLGSTSKRAALEQADRVVVLVDGAVVATGPWTRLSDAWGHLAG